MAPNAVDHVGISVADLDRSIAFWEGLLERPVRDRRLLEGPGLGVLAAAIGLWALRLLRAPGRT
jgi:catechol 2,3-dioxygenase-like lactoylglutathione lyase family enzyme